jgi:hypothetical protein
MDFVFKGLMSLENSRKYGPTRNRARMECLGMNFSWEFKSSTPWSRVIPEK